MAVGHREIWRVRSAQREGATRTRAAAPTFVVRPKVFRVSRDELNRRNATCPTNVGCFAGVDLVVVPSVKNCCSFRSLEKKRQPRNPARGRSTGISELVIGPVRVTRATGTSARDGDEKFCAARETPLSDLPFHDRTAPVRSTRSWQQSSW
jgi:hypothetical protein